MRRSELFAKIVLGLTSDVDVGEIIQAQRKSELRRMSQLTALKEHRDLSLDLAEILQLDMFIMRTEATIRWLDTAEAKILKAGEQVPTGVSVRDALPTAEAASAQDERGVGETAGGSDDRCEGGGDRS